MAREGIPVVGHLGLVPRHVTWTGYRAIGKTVEEAKELYRRMKELESAGAYGAELEVVPHNLARFQHLAAQTKADFDVARIREWFAALGSLLFRMTSFRRIRGAAAAARQGLPRFSGQEYRPACRKSG